MIGNIDKTLLQDFIVRNLAEDVGNGDHTSNACIDSEDRTEGYLLAKDDGIICGIPVAKAILNHVTDDVTITEMISEGSPIKKGDIVFYVSCNTRAFLMAERLLLNTMQRMSAIATMSHKFAAEVNGLDVKILDTRKTTPGLRFLEKYAVAVGGCENYRIGLYDWIMIKDNHIDAAGGVTEAIQAVHDYQKKNQLNLGITVEVRSLEELDKVLAIGGVTQIMFDNFEPSELRKGVEIVGSRFRTEASGGINLSTVRTYAETGVDYVSSGALTHSVIALDLSLKVKKDS